MLTNIMVELSNNLNLNKYKCKLLYFYIYKFIYYYIYMDDIKENNIEPLPAPISIDKNVDIKYVKYIDHLFDENWVNKLFIITPLDK